jgi:hypothetical protein
MTAINAIATTIAVDQREKRPIVDAILVLL